ncbi:MAG: hypothetical protein OIF50_17650 [Flavobacteriaceae bacterium]|nr:hypothetical protein [Flavobacteriaceae bacterium]
MGYLEIVYTSDHLLHEDRAAKILKLEDEAVISFNLVVRHGAKPPADYVVPRFRFELLDLDNDKRQISKNIQVLRHRIRSKAGPKSSRYRIRYEKIVAATDAPRDMQNIERYDYFLEFQRPEPVIEQISWHLPDKARTIAPTMHLGQWVILRIKTKHLEQETIGVSLWELDLSKESIKVYRSGNMAGDNFNAIYDNQLKHPETGKTWEGTSKDMDFGFLVSPRLSSSRIDKKGNVELLIQLNPNWIDPKREAGDMDTFSDFRHLELVVKVDHPRLPKYDEIDSDNGSRTGLFYKPELKVNMKTKVVPMPNIKDISLNNAFAAIIQNDKPMEARGYKPCSYSHIYLIDQGKKHPLFEEKEMIPMAIDPLHFLIGKEKEIVNGKEIEKESKTITIEIDNKNSPEGLKLCKKVYTPNKNIVHDENWCKIEGTPDSYFATIGPCNLDIEVFPVEIKPATAIQYAYLPNIEPVLVKAYINSCNYSRMLDLRFYPDLQYEISFKSSGAENLYDFKTDNFVTRDYKGSLGLLRKKKQKKQNRKNKKALRQYNKSQKEKDTSKALEFSQYQIAMEYALAGEKQKEISFSGEHPVFDAIDSAMYLVNKIRDLCFQKEMAEAFEEHSKRQVTKLKDRVGLRKKHLKSVSKNGKALRKKIEKKAKKFAKKTDKFAPFSIAISPPTFAGSVSWKLSPSTQKGREHILGTEYTINLKTDPLIEIEGRLDLLFVITKIPYLGPVVKGMTATADAVGGMDDIWNSLVDFFGGKEEMK